MGQRGRPKKLPDVEVKPKKMAQASLDNLKKGKRFTGGPNGTAAAAAKKGQQAQQAAVKKRKTMSQLAAQISSTRVGKVELADMLKQLGVDDDNLTNSAAVVAAIFQAACDGNLGAVEKWETMVAQGAEQNGDSSETRKFLIPAILMARSFVDLNRQIDIKDNAEIILEGGRGSTKSTYISLKIIELMKQDPGLSAVIIRKIKGNMRESVFEQMKWAISELGLDAEWKCTVSPMQIKNIRTDQRIIFRGLDDPTKIKSIKPPAGQRIGILWVEEASELYGPEELRSVKQSTLRGGDGIVFLSYNPPKSRTAWINKYTLESQQDDKHKITVHHSTYLDVPPEWLGTKFLEEAEHLKETQPQSYEHEYLGVATGDGGAVFNNLEIREITDEELKSFDRIYMGLDWGYFPDPLAFVRLHYDRTREKIYFIDELYVNKWSNQQTADELKQRGYTDTYITCDSAEPKSIADLRGNGVPARAAVKGADSVRYGIKWLDSRTLVIDPKRTPNVLKEFSGYEMERDREGNPIDAYPDKNNHLIDATRYALECVSRKKVNPA